MPNETRPPPSAGLPEPTAPSRRVHLVDALRGAAMLGIMLVNFPSMNTMAGDETTLYGGQTTALDRFVGGANMLLLNGKFYPIFALLFGLGLFLFVRSGCTLGLAARRMLILLAIGLVHVTLVWWGDILVVYAVLGLVALPGLGWSPGRLLAVALVLLVLVPALSPLLGLLDHLGLVSADRALLPGLGLVLPTAEAAAATYAHGTFAEMLRQRYLDWLSDFTPFTAGSVSLGTLLGYGAYYAQLLGLFLLGIWAGRRGLHESLAADRPRTLRAWWIATPIALALTGLRLGLPDLRLGLSYFQGNTLALDYVLSFVLLFTTSSRVRGGFESVGRLSLTAYLAHTTFASLLLYGTGLGLYGSIGPAALLPISVGFYALVAWGCVAWLGRFQMGPAEWAWRSLLYGRALPMRRATEAG